MRGAGPRGDASSGAEEPIARVRGLHVSYGPRHVLNGIDLDIQPGRVMVLLGPNGAGKTTLVRSICGRLSPDIGSVSVGGHPAQSEAARRLIGLAPQEIALYPTLTVKENLEVFARLSGVPRAALADHVARILARTGIAARAAARIDQLSGGFRRRANLAAALVGTPRLLILDEPSVGVDRDAWRPIAELIRRLAREGLAILMITHDFAQAEEVADEVVFLVKGHVALRGGVRDLIARHFDGGRIVEVALLSPPDAAEAARLSALGLQPTREPRTYRGLIPGSAEALSDLILALKREEIAPGALSVSAPGLGALYPLVTGEGQA